MSTNTKKSTTVTTTNIISNEAPTTANNDNDHHKFKTLSESKEVFHSTTTTIKTNAPYSKVSLPSAGSNSGSDLEDLRDILWYCWS